MILRLSIVLLLIAPMQVSCEKEVKKIIGEYKGTERHLRGTQENPSLYKDSLVQDIIITVFEGSESTRKSPTLLISFNSSQQFPNSSQPVPENVPVKDGQIKYYRSTSEVGVMYSIVGWIKNDSLTLASTTNRFGADIIQVVYKAKKQ